MEREKTVIFPSHEFPQEISFFQISPKPSVQEIEKLRENLRHELDDYKEIFLCRLCKARITTSGEKIKMLGKHLHTFVNPGGISFRIRCFSVAPGAAGIGIPTFEFTWFPGYAWQMAVCGSCGTHLGWKYLSESGTDFWGLIARNLIKTKESGQEKL